MSNLHSFEKRIKIDLPLFWRLLRQKYPLVGNSIKEMYIFKNVKACNALLREDSIDTILYISSMRQIVRISLLYRNKQKNKNNKRATKHKHLIV